ncbi:hypothetical protein L873DRAFT_1171993 [Choiromyces venosus 120613-1]|uniref:Uncharacterized protein n=1 Tax=Choiromyces venosus 120613-1 TaxID=1336337 RepID=A0A3N4K2J8_9PEZI|nr:hypothetical protein L873DRAFT_1171993 [Choiromyces venosus 120613-1]
MGNLGSVNLAATHLGELQAQYVKFKMSTNFSNFSGWPYYMVWLCANIHFWCALKRCPSGLGAVMVVGLCI